MKITPRPYQTESIKLIQKKFRGTPLTPGIKNILLVLPCGAGKTTVASEMIRMAVANGRRVIFIAHRRELIKQAAGRLAQYGLSCGLITPNERVDYTQLIQVASIQTLLRRDLPPGHLIIVDEAHTAISKQYLAVLRKYQEKGAFIIGLSATPFRTNKREGLNILFDDFVANIKMSQLIEQGYLVPTKVFASAKISSKNMKTQHGEFMDSELMRAFDVDKVYVNLLSNFAKLAGQLKTIVFCCNVSHSMKTVAAFNEAGYSAAHIDGTTPSAERDAIIADFRTGKIQILSNYNILTEGFDVPDTECVILNLATKSQIKYIQAVGRGLRPAPGKTFCTVLDLADNTERFGYVDEDLEISLSPQSTRDSNGVAPIRCCPQCDFIQHASIKICGNCNFEFPKTKHEILEEEFVEVARSRRTRVWGNYTKKDWHKVKDEELEEFAVLKGYSKGWVTIEKARRKEKRKIIMLQDYSGSDYYRHTNFLTSCWYNNKAIPAEKFVFDRETKSHVYFRWVGVETPAPVEFVEVF